MVEDRKEIKTDEWKRDLEKEVMKVARSKMARRIMAGVEQWAGMMPSYEEVVGRCSFCHKSHELNFENTMLSCRDHRWDAAQKEIRKSWGVDSDSLLFGRIPKTLFRQWVNDTGDLGKAFREARVKMKHWERIILNLRKKLE